MKIIATLILPTLIILTNLTHQLDAPEYPNPAYVKNIPFINAVTVSAGDQLRAEIYCAQPAVDVAVSIYSGADYTNYPQKMLALMDDNPYGLKNMTVDGEILSYTFQSNGTCYVYFSSVQLSSADSIFFGGCKATVQINGELLFTQSGYISDYQYPAPYFFLNISNPACYTVAVTGKYGSGNETISIYSPDADFLGQTSSVGNRFASFNASQTGMWAVRVKFPFPQPFTLVQDAIIIAQNCINCEQISYVNTTEYIHGQTCRCETDFNWDEDKALCMIECGNFNQTTGNTSEFDVCLCQEGFLWNRDTFSCQINCAQFNHTEGNSTDNISCPCEAGYQWNSAVSQCQIQCQFFNNTVGNSTDNTTCMCRDGYVWDQTVPRCEVNCSFFDFTQGPAAENNTCECKPQFDWKQADADSPICIINCSRVAYSLPSSPTNTTYSCKCEEGFIWSEDLLVCAVDCDNMDGASGSKDALTCSCRPGSTWDKATLSCVTTKNNRTGFIVGVSVGGTALVAMIIGSVIYLHSSSGANVQKIPSADQSNGGSASNLIK